MSKIMQAALDPSCLLCLTPDGWYSPLRQGVVWPGPPRNFATEPATWRNFMVKAAAIGEHDFRFKIRFFFNSTIVGDSIFTPAERTGSIAIFRSSIYFYVRTFVNGASVNSNGGLIADIYDKETEVIIQKESGQMIVWLNGNVILNLATSAYNFYDSFPSNMISSFNGLIYDTELEDLTTHETIWSYPSYVERLRLITSTNVLNTGTHWEAANPALGWSIKTALPAGIAGTVLAKINGEYIVNPVQWNRTTATFTGAATDTLEGLIVFNEVITYEQIAYLCGVKRWAIPVSAGNINIVTVGFQNLRWTFPDGSTSTAESINQTVAAGVITCEYVGLLNGQLAINNSTALASSAIRAIDLPRVTTTLQLQSLPGLTGTIADLPRVTNTLQLQSLPGLTGTIADLPRVTNYLQLYNLPWLTGTTADLPRVTGTLYLSDLPGLTGTTADLPANTSGRWCYVAANVTGALSVVATNTPIYFYSTGATALEYDETVHNCVVAGGLSKTLHIGTGTSAGDADIQTLRDRGWSVTIH